MVLGASKGGREKGVAWDERLDGAGVDLGGEGVATGEAADGGLAGWKEGSLIPSGGARSDE